MTLSAGTVSLGVKPDAKGFGESLHRSLMGDSAITGAGKHVGGMLMAGLGAVGIAASIGGIIKTGMGEAMDASAGTAQLTAGLKSTHNAANVTVQGMNDLASSIQNYSGQTDDSIVKSEQLLLTFTNIKNKGPDKIFDLATKASADMAAKMGGDASGSAILLGKALNDPVKGISALSRVGVSFTDGQKKTIASMVKMGDTAGAQKVILKELGTEFGGAGKAAGESLPGMVARGKRAFEDLSQTVATMLLPVLVPVLNGVVTVLQKALPHVQAFSDGVGKAFALVKDGFTKGTDSIGSSHSKWAAFGAVAHEVFDKIKSAVGTVWKTIGPVFEGIGGLIKNLAPTFGPLIGQIFHLVTTFSPMSMLLKALGPIMPTLVTALTSLGAVIGSALSTAIKSLMPVLGVLAHVLGNVLATILPVIIHLISVLAPIFADLLPPIMQVIGVLAQVLAPVLQMAGVLLVGLIHIIVPILIPVIKLLGSIISVVFHAIAAVFSWLWNSVIKPIAGFVGGAIRILGDVFGKVFGGLGGVIRGAFNGVVGFIKGIINSVIDVVNGAIGAINGIAGAVKNATGGAIDIHLGTIPHLAEGGIVPATPGGRLVRVAEAGEAEAIVPLSKAHKMFGGGSGGGGAVINVHPSEGMSEHVIGRIAAETLNYRMRAAT